METIQLSLMKLLLYIKWTYFALETVCVVKRIIVYIKNNLNLCKRGFQYKSSVKYSFLILLLIRQFRHLTNTFIILIFTFNKS